MLLLALVSQPIGHTCFNWEIECIKPQLLTLVILGDPLIASLLGYLIFKEISGIRVLGGAAILVVGVAIATLSTQQHQKKLAK